ncbi:hypothetical protein FDZ71_17935 [bacterium]|nr:MAG: hypothetical protein FDZ71_17935 [bacterium]
MFNTPEAIDGESVSIGDIEYLDGRSRLARKISKLVSLDEIEDATESQIMETLSPLHMETCADTRVCVFNVGQGNCVAIASIPTFPHLYFDFGGGCYGNSSTYPTGLRFCFSNNPPIVLSHWDKDHWVSGRKHPQAMSMKWIAPRQILGFWDRKFASDLHNRENLLIWPSSLPSISFPLVILLKLSGTNHRHNSGLVLIASVSGGDVLCPGDAPYSLIPRAASTNLVGLVASHHGGKCGRGNPPTPSAGGCRVVYSFGVPGYGHPSPRSVAKHHRVGWTQRIDTPNGHAAVPSVNPLPMPPACGGYCCNLTLQQ